MIKSVTGNIKNIFLNDAFLLFLFFFIKLYIIKKKFDNTPNADIEINIYIFISFVT